MPTVIDAAAVTTGRWPASRSARRLAGAAGRAALRKCMQEPSEVDLLLNAGLYHDRNLGEPALAPLIQEDIAVNPGDPSPGGRGTFSFDVANGTAGVLTALHIVDGFMRARTISTALIVASDADPGHGLAPDFPFRSSGGALVCHWTDRPVGLGSFRWYNQPDGDGAFRTTVGIRGGRNVLAVEQSGDYAAKLAEAAGQVVTSLLESEDLEPDAVDAVLAAPDLPGMRSRLAALTGLPAERFVSVSGRTHTVGAISLIEQAGRAGLMRSPGTVLLVGAGAGVTAGAAVYRI